jgi:uncharacterized membrane protein YfcA
MTVYMGIDVVSMYTGTFTGVPRWAMALTMIGGSFIAGATSEGGASVAFPVMTLGFGFQPEFARDFSLAIQSVGMVAAAFVIWCQRIPVELRMIKLTFIPGTIGVLVGIVWVAPFLPSTYSKMVFVATWFAFASSLYCLNRHRDRVTFQSIQHISTPPIIVCGFLGGVLTSISGNGMDIATFALSVLYFHLSESVATPTSVVVMAMNTCVGFGCRILVAVYGQHPIDPAVWEFLYVCAPVVVVGAPVGAIVAARMHRRTLASFLYVTDTAQLVAALFIVPQTVRLLLTTAGVIISGVAVFWYIAMAGRRRVRQHTVGPAEGSSDNINMDP